MKKRPVLPYLALAIGFVLFHVIALVIPSEKTATFLVAYAFTVLAFLVQAPLWKLALAKRETLKSKFLGIPVIYVGLLYLLLHLIAFAVFMAVPMLPAWLATVLCAAITALSFLGVIGARAGVGMIERTEDRIKTKRAFIQFLQIDLEMLAEGEPDPTVKAALIRLSEAVRFSDPMSSELLEDLEAKIAAKAEALKGASDKLPLIGEIELLLTERNKKCKALK